MKQFVCYFIGHVNKWNNGDPKCIRCGRKVPTEPYLQEHLKNNPGGKVKF